MQKIGVMGGTFDPIHNGHLIAAAEAAQQLALDEVVFIPAGTPPHKPAAGTAARHRHFMCILATLDNPMFSVSSMEIERAGPSYTIDTISQLKAQLPHAHLYFIVGTDVTIDFHKWRKFDEILQLCTVVVITRPGSPAMEVLPEKYGEAVMILEIPAIDISSTKIRAQLARGDCPRYFLPLAVWHYICKKGLYSGPLHRFMDKLKANLSKERYLHCLSVMTAAEELGKLHKMDEAAIANLKLAALLHDCAKNRCEDSSFVQLAEFCNENGATLDTFYYNDTSLAHSFVGAIVARVEYGIADLEILSAIACHTFGKPQMTTFDKIIYIADYIEPRRPPSEPRNHAKKLACDDLDLDAAMMFILRNIINENAALGLPIHTDSLAALKDLEDNYGKN